MIETATEIFDALNAQDFEAIERLYAPEAVVHSSEGPLRGPGGIIKLIKDWDHAFVNLQAVPLHYTEDGDVVVVHWRATGKQVLPFRGMEGGRMTKCYGHTRLRIKEKQVVEHWACVDYRALAGDQDLGRAESGLKSGA